MKNLVQDIKNKLKQICPEHLSTKKKYATKKQLTDFEKKSGLKFPEELVEFWLHCDFDLTVDAKIYQALQLDDESAFFIFDELKYLIELWEEDSGHKMPLLFKAGTYYTFPNRGFEEGILCEAVYDKAWFPIASASDGSVICIDLHPGVNGTHGQLLYVMFVGNGKSGPYYSGYTSLHALLTNYLEDLEAGRFEVEEELVYPLNYKYEGDGNPERISNNNFPLVLKELKDLHQTLAPGQLTTMKVDTATDADIATLEAIIEDKLPADFITYLKTQDYTLEVNGYYDTFSVNEMIESLKGMNKLLAEGIFDDGRVERHIKENFGNWNGDYLKQVWWSNKWIPFAQDGCGNMKCIDLDPGENGTKGQIMSMEIQDGQGPYIDRDHKSFFEYMKYQLLLAKNGRYELHDNWKGGNTMRIDSEIEPGDKYLSTI